MNYGLIVNRVCAFGECAAAVVHMVRWAQHKLYDDCGTNCTTAVVHVICRPTYKQQNIKETQADNNRNTSR